MLVVFLLFCISSKAKSWSLAIEETCVCWHKCAQLPNHFVIFFSQSFLRCAVMICSGNCLALWLIMSHYGQYPKNGWLFQLIGHFWCRRSHVFSVFGLLQRHTSQENCHLWGLWCSDVHIISLWMGAVKLFLCKKQRNTPWLPCSPFYNS